MNNPIPEKSLYILRHSNMPAVLGEFGFMDSAIDTPVILTDAFAAQVAQGVVGALVAARPSAPAARWERIKRKAARPGGIIRAGTCRENG